ncbi:MAG: CPBP family intramembrane metalloprotease [Anaerolineales bacterium]|nr:CPBP family intramembrane metalloprotease [Anaerolineales bacterium]
MAFSPLVVSLLLILFTSGLLVVTGLKKQPGIGVIGAVVVIALALWGRGEGLRAIGFEAPDNWVATVLLGLGLGAAIQLLAIVLIEPLSEKITATRHDHSLLDNVKGNWKALLQWLVLVWLLVAFLEEAVFRGFLMTEVAKVLGTGPWSLAINVIFTSVVFGLAHGYQSRAGILSTGLVGALLAILFVLSDFNLWLAIFTHGFIDTIGISLIASETDQLLRKKVWGTGA